MLKDAPPEERLAAVEIVARGDALIAPAVTRAVIEEFVRSSRAPRRATAPVIDSLTPREREGPTSPACSPSSASATARRR